MNWTHRDSCQVLMRLQIILQLRPNPRIGLFFEKIPEVFLPVLWFDAEAAIDEEMASQVPWPQCDTTRKKTNYDTVSFWKNLLEIGISTSVFFFLGKDVGSDANSRPALWCDLSGWSCPLSCPLPQVGQCTTAKLLWTRKFSQQLHFQTEESNQ